MLSVTAVQRSYVGGRAQNEDFTAIAQQGAYWCLVVADGAGGHSHGATAARVAVNKIIDGFRARPPTDADDLAELLLDGHDAVLAAQRKPRKLMHATIVVLIVDPQAGLARWGHVGDSRLYALRWGGVAHVTRDDSVVQRMVDSGFISAETARSHPQKNRLMAALGARIDVRPTVAREPYRLEDGDAFLLCTDGWWDFVSAPEIEQSLALCGDADGWLDSMATLIARRAHRGNDNFSAIGCWVGDPRQSTRIIRREPVAPGKTT